MSNAIATNPSQRTFTQEELGLITNTIAKGASPKEMELFLHRCKNMGLDPLKPGQIHFVKYSTGPGTIVIGIEGFRSIAARSGKLSGIKRGAIRNEKGELTGGWAEVYRSDWQHPAREEAPLAEYNTNRGPWAKMPETMIKKVAECAALRMAFPDDLGGVYEQAEMDQARGNASDAGLPRVYPDQPGSEDGTPDSQYRIPFGKFRMRTLEEVGVDQLKSYVTYLEDTAKKKGTEIQGQVLEFIDMASEFIASWENGDST